MIRAGVRERAVSMAVVGLLLFLLLQTYISDISMAEEEEELGREMAVDIETYPPPLQDSVLPGEIDVEEPVEQEVAGSYYITANEIAPPGRLDDMVEAGQVDMDKYIREKEDALSQENLSAKTSTETEAGPHSQLLARPPNVKGVHPGFMYSGGNRGPYTSALAHLRLPNFTLPQEVITPDKGYIDIGFIVINLKKSPSLDPKFAWKVTRSLDSLFLYSSGDPLHFVIVTDVKSVAAVGVFYSNFISKALSQRVIISPSWRWRRLKAPPPLKFTFVDIANIKKVDPDFVESMKNNSMSKEKEDKDKYASDLFYISPLYHRAFSGLQKLIFMDSTDLEFFSDIKELQAQFDAMPEGAVMSLGLDLSPHYRKFLGQGEASGTGLNNSYIGVNPQTKLGLPGKQQGFNTGVVLFRLDRMRASSLYNEYISGSRVTQLRSLYMFDFALGDQDWLTDLGFSHPDLFHVLPCPYNRQTSIQYLAPPWEKQFDSYHYCCPKSQVKIMHRNGCGPTPEHCGNPVSPESAYWKNKPSHMYYLHMDVGALWEVMADTKGGGGSFGMFKPLDSK